MPRQKFLQIYSQLKQRIESGQYPVGQLLPSENTLIGEFDCSRNTVRRAISELVRDGYVQTRQGWGVCNIFQPIEHSSYTMGMIESFRETARRTGQTSTTRVVAFDTCVANEAIAAPAQMSPNAPRIETTKIPADRIGELIGPGGKNIKAIQAESGADINIEEDGTVHIYAAKQEGLDRALELVTRMFKTIEIGELYTGKIVSTTTFGAFMEVLPGKDGLIHISELAEGRTAKTEDVVSVGDVVTAKCIGIDDKGRVKMSIRAALRDAKAAEAEAAGIT